MKSVELFRRKGMSFEARGRDLVNMAAGYTTSNCIIKVNSTGEAKASFRFACKYAQLPTINYGFQLQTDPPAGRTPLITCTVSRWYSEDRLPNSRLYTGAELLIVSENVDGISFVVTATAHGIAFSGPTNEVT